MPENIKAKIEEVTSKLIKLRDEISYQYYEISVPMEHTKIMKRLDRIINLLIRNK